MWWEKSLWSRCRLGRHGSVRASWEWLGIERQGCAGHRRSASPYHSPRGQRCYTRDLVWLTQSCVRPEQGRSWRWVVESGQAGGQSVSLMKVELCGVFVVPDSGRYALQTASAARPVMVLEAQPVSWGGTESRPAPPGRFTFNQLLEPLVSGDRLPTAQSGWLSSPAR
jgi:hypothetical protein